MSQTTSITSSKVTSSLQEEETFPRSIDIKAEELLLLGQTQLVKQNLEKGLEFFEKASQLKPNDPKLYFEQGLSLFEFGTEEDKEKTLLLANKKFKLATTLLPEYFEAWQLWGMSLSYLGRTYQEYHYFCKAEDKLKKAIELSEGKQPEVLSDLYWEFALVKMESAEHSGEVHDWLLSIEAFEQASSFENITDPDFWNQFGLACLSMAKRVNDIRICVKSVHNFKHAISYDANHLEGWRNLSLAMQFLYECTHDEDHFSQANECFATCSNLHPLDETLWLEWALFLCKSGRKTLDVRRLQSSISKCSKAYEINAEDPTILACWGESLALIGELTEKIDLIHEGRNKLLEAAELLPGDPQIWRGLGESSICMGNYFSEYDYLYQAVEHFQEGLSLDRTCHDLWISIARAYTLIGKMLSDPDTLIKAVHFYNKAINLQPRSSYYHFEYGYCLSKIGQLTQEEQWLESSIQEFEQALHIQKNALYLHPDWLFQYAKTLDLYADFFEEDSYYHKAIEIFSHVLMIDPDFPRIHYQLAITYSHLGELLGEIEHFYRSLHYFKLAAKHDDENDQILVDLGVTLINIAQYSSDSLEIEICYKDAEVKLTQAIKSGNLQGYYQLSCLFSLLGQTDKALAFLIKTESFNALPATEDLLEDDWLDRVRSSEGFKDFLQYLEKKACQHEEL